MPQFLFQPDPIDGVKFKPIRIDIHQGVIKIMDDEIFYDFQLNYVYLKKMSDGKIIINKLDQLIIMQKFCIACDFR